MNMTVHQGIFHPRNIKYRVSSCRRRGAGQTGHSLNLPELLYLLGFPRLIIAIPCTTNATRTCFLSAPKRGINSSLDVNHQS